MTPRRLLYLDSSVTAHRVTQGSRHPLVHAQARHLCRPADLRVHLRRQAQHQAPRKGFVGRLAHGFASRQVAIYRLLEGRLQFSHRGAMETYHVSDTDHTPHKEPQGPASPEGQT